MNQDAIQLFAEKFESLAGHVHHAPTVAEAVEAAIRILTDEAVQCVALAAVPDAVQEALTEHATAAGLALHSAPYLSASALDQIDAAQAGITLADFAIAETGTVVEITTDDADRLVSSLPRTHICIVDAQTVVQTLQDAAAQLRDAFEQHDQGVAVSFISGPSRTGDIEMKLTLGVHGPEVAHTIIVQDMESA